MDRGIEIRVVADLHREQQIHRFDRYQTTAQALPIGGPLIEQREEPVAELASPVAAKRHQRVERPARRRRLDVVIHAGEESLPDRPAQIDDLIADGHPDPGRFPTAPAPEHPKRQVLNREIPVRATGGVDPTEHRRVMSLIEGFGHDAIAGRSSSIGSRKLQEPKPWKSRRRARAVARSSRPLSQTIASPV